MSMFIAIVTLIIVCLLASDLLSERDVVRNRLSKVESAIRELQQTEESRKLAQKKRGV